VLGPGYVTEVSLWRSSYASDEAKGLRTECRTSASYSTALPTFAFRLWPRHFDRVEFEFQSVTDVRRFALS
jgi:hypothetical protein